MVHQLANGEAVIRRCSIKTQPEITCSKLTIETLEQGTKYVQSTTPERRLVLVSLLTYFTPCS